MHAQGVRQRTDVVVLDARENEAGRLELTLLTTRPGPARSWRATWVACAVPPRPADELWHALRGAARIARRSRCTGWVTASPRAGPTPRYSRASGPERPYDWNEH